MKNIFHFFIRHGHRRRRQPSLLCAIDWCMDDSKADMINQLYFASGVLKIRDECLGSIFFPSRKTSSLLIFFSFFSLSFALLVNFEAKVKPLTYKIRNICIRSITQDRQPLSSFEEE